MRYLKPVLTLMCVNAVVIAGATPVPKAWKQIYARVSKTIVANDVPGYMTWMDKRFINIQDGGATGVASEPKESSASELRHPQMPSAKHIRLPNTGSASGTPVKS